MMEDLEEMKKRNEELYRETSTHRFNLSVVGFRDSEDRALVIDAPFIVEEVKNATIDCDGDKTSGPVSFILAFYYRKLEYIKSKI